MPPSSPASWAFLRWSARGDATEKLREGEPVTVSCAEGDTGYVYEGKLEVEVVNLSRRRDAQASGQDHA